MKLLNYRTLLVVIITVLNSWGVNAQIIDSALLKLDAEYPQEKIYVQYDKGAYTPGETIWLKAYIMVGSTITTISNNLYTELIDGSGKVLDRRISPIAIGGAAAALYLPETLKDSTVFIRAYTRWMLNFDSAFLYTKAIPILQPANKNTGTGKPAAATYYLDFFPEGGDLIQGVSTRLAFKANDQKGLPIPVTGDILNSKGTKVASFSSVHQGMGLVELTPVAGETYKASWKDPSGKMQQKNLPAAKAKGVALAVQNTLAGIQYNVKRKEGEAVPYETVQVVAQTQQQMIYRAKVNLTKSAEVKAMIPIEHVPAGIVQVTLFTEDNKPIAERIVFVNRQDYYFITDLNVPLKGMKKRDRNVIQVDVPDEIQCNLSISVTDADINPVQKGEEDIYSGLLLSPDIKGYIHQPGYYFSSEADSVAQHLDLVMMTNGWRRFKWEDILAGKFPEIRNKPEDYITANGKITGLTKSELVNQELTGILTLKGGGQQFITIPVASDGTFGISGMVFYDTAKLYYQFNNDKNKLITTKALIDVKTAFLPGAIPFSAANKPIPVFTKLDPAALQKSLMLGEKNLAAAEAARKVKTLETVTVTAKVKSKAEKMNEEYTSGLFRGQNDYTFITEDDISANGAMTVLNYLQGKVAGLQITGMGTNISMNWRGGTPSLFLNEMISDISMVQNIPMTDVAMVKVFRPPFLGAPGGGSAGAIAVYTKKGAAANENIKGLNFANIPGYVPQKEFYSPDYMRYEQRHDQEDIRSTLFWNPFIITDKDNRRILFTVYNNDSAKRWRIIVEGVNAEGKLTRMERIVE
ncbi:hypothetical protein [Flavihumibacter sp. CACIAM 22H1]|uniref:hypothetical protein n=1 Tax=Flavihumibacter sp. CACIAM 22H1 TaxID=1812911 RepID=UPI0007A84AE3|nr:hypothetical protein [Flavihumibacter sp. CACIAM 22H1]KYP16405.1 MAG: hypothetical protein A1D16_17265 [Flavihumibacter sp. CACIAM 22H1]